MNKPDQFKIALFSWFLPPSSEIMARRWGKLIPELQKKGVEVHLITTERKCDESIFPKAYFYYLKQTLPETLVYGTKNFSERITGLFWRSLIFLFTRGSKFDRALFMRCKVRRVVQQLRRNNVNVVIATGSPNHLLYILAKEKKKQRFKYVVDLRDPWAWGKQFESSKNSFSRKQKEKQKLSFVIANADLVYVPSIAMQNQLVQWFPDEAKKIQHLPHGVDAGIVGKHAEIQKQDRKSKRRLIYGGTFYSGSRNVLIQFDLLLKNLGRKICDYDIYTHDAIIETYKGKLTSSSIHLNPFLPEEKLFGEIRKSDYYLAFYPPEYKDFISAKIFEVVALGIPFILVSETGILSDFIVSNRLGIHIPASEFESKILEVIEMDVPEIQKINLGNYYFHHLAGQVKKQISEI